METLQRMQHAVLPLILAAALAVPAATPTVKPSWPMHRADASLSGAVDEQLPEQLALQWTYKPLQPPWPAWPEPGRELNRLAFDRCFNCAVADGTVYFGSSATGKVHALELDTGRERWSFFTGGPVRFAPAVAGGRVYATSDDGYIYCLAAADGTEVWRFRGGPEDAMIMGHDRLISRWPMRNGCVVVNDTVYTVAGTFPSEGIYVYALSSADGSVRWCNDTGGSIYMNQPHPGAQAMTGVAPQGQIMAHEGRLFVPTGRNVPAAFDMQTGELIYYHGAPKNWGDRWGGVWTMGLGEFFITPQTHRGPDIEARYGESDPWPNDGLTLMTCSDGTAAVELPDMLCATTGSGVLYACSGEKVTAYDLKALQAGTAPTECVIWETPHGRAYEIVRAGSVLFVGGREVLTALSAGDGSQLWQQNVGAQVRSLAVAEGRLLASLDDGRILCYGAEQVTTPGTVGGLPTQTPYPDDDLTRAAIERARRIMADTGINEGYCVLLGIGDGRLAHALAQSSDLTLFAVDADPAKVASARDALERSTRYGTRVTVLDGDLDALALPPYLANLVVVNAPGASLAEAYRVCRPEGGRLYVLPGAERGPLMAAGATGREIIATGTPAQVVRGSLPGAGAWTHQYGDAGKSGCSTDRRVRVPLKTLWFGEPGPERMVSRHWRPPSPVAADGRIFIAAQDYLIATDAYNGRELWTWGLQRVGRRSVDQYGGNLAVADGSVFVVTGDACFRLDAATGQLTRTYTVPAARQTFNLAEAVEIELDEGNDRAGSVTITATDSGIEMVLMTVDARVTCADRAELPGTGDSWELCFDFRPRELAGGRYGPGAFRIGIIPATIEHDEPAWGGLSGLIYPDIEVTGSLSETGSRTTVLLSWDDIGRLTGNGKPADFGFGCTLNCSDDGKKVVRRVHTFTDGDSYRLTTPLARMVLDEAAVATMRPPGDLLPAAEVETKMWEHLAVDGGTVYGSLGSGAEASHFFALDVETGALKWLYTAEEAINSNAVLVTDGLVVLLDRTPDARITQMKRRGEEISVRYTLRALNAETGREAWATRQRISGLRALFAADGFLVATGPKAMNAYHVADGRMVWATNTKTNKFPVIVDGVIYNEPRAYELQTGRQVKRLHPLTSAEVGWDYARSYGCGSIAGAPGMLLFRSGTIGFCDIAGDSGIHNYGAVRAGCYVNAIAANGLVIAPCADAGCTCSYNFQTSVALMPTEREEAWSVFRATGADALAPIRNAALNLGAPGDRRDDDDTMWLSLPRPPAAGAMKLTAELSPSGQANLYRHNADMMNVAGTRRPWLYASGCTGPAKLSIPTLWGAPVGLPGDTARQFTVRLHFAEPDAIAHGQRVFDVKLQGKTALEALDIVAEAGGARRALVKEMTDVEAASSIDVELVPITGEPLLCAVELIEQ